MSSEIKLKALGLNTSPNSLDVPDGSLLEATNVVIRRDNVIEPRRGFKIYSETFGTSTDVAKQLFVYRERILNHYNNVLEYDTGILNDDGEAIFNAFAGNYLEPLAGYRIRSIESNGNFYFTTSDGVKKISASGPEDFTTAAGFITDAGGVKALDGTAELNIVPGNQTGFLTQDSAVAYRIVWVKKDVNDNTVPGAPSQRIEVYLSLLSLLLFDFNRLLQALDNINQTGSLINDGNYVSTYALSDEAPAGTLRANLIGLATKIDQDIIIANATGVGAAMEIAVGDITMSGSTATATPSSGSAPDIVVAIGDTINILTDYTMTTGTIPAGQYVITNVTNTTFSFIVTTGSPTGSNTNTATIDSYNYRSIATPAVVSTPATNDQLVALQTYLNNIVLRLQAELSGVISSVLINEYIVPFELTTSATVFINFPIPAGITEDYYFQIYRSAVTTATGTTSLNDIAPSDEMGQVYEAYPTAAELLAGEITVEDIVLDSFRGANLYTNPITGEGILQANDVIPFARDINRFKNYIFYANTRTREQLSLSLLGISTFYESQTITSIAVGATTSITIDDHGYTSGDIIVIKNSNSVPNVDGAWTITVTGTDTFTIPFDTSGGTNGTEGLAFKNNNATLTIANDTTSNTYTFTLGAPENTEVDFDSAGPLSGTDFNASGVANYFEIWAGDDSKAYYVWYHVNGGTMTDPAVADKTGIQVVINTGDSATDISEKTRDAINVFNFDFQATSHTSGTNNRCNILTTKVGYTTDAINTDMPTGVTITTNADGQGEDASNNEVLLSTSDSPAIGVDETSRSLLSVVNRNPNEIVYIFYLSSSAEIPGKMFIQARSLSVDTFYITTSGDIGSAFNPPISPTNEISNISVANPTVVTSAGHGLTDGDQIVISGSNSTPSIDGVYTVSDVTVNTFTIPVNVTIVGTTGSFVPAEDSVFSNNQNKPNRIYYSKLQQPEAVPALNFIDIGAENKEILRIFPLRDSLFIFKQDGLWRISGEVAPFSTALFDGSCGLIAPDSVDLINNLIFCWTSEGIQSVSEAGVDTISRSIDVDILKLSSANYPNFKTATWGVGYDSDNAYYVGTVSEPEDVNATIIYRYSTLTDSWTTIDKSKTVGIINPTDDKLYFGAGDVNKLEQERKLFDRTDFADRETFALLTVGNYLGNQIKLTTVEGINIGDVFLQEQTVTVYGFNALLQKLDIDPGVADDDYFATIAAAGGNDMRVKVASDLANKLDADAGVNDTDYAFTVATKNLSYVANTSGSTSTITLKNENFVAGDVNTGTDTITIVGHPFLDDEQVTFTTSNTLPGGLALNARYYILNAGVNTFQLSLTPGGSVHNLTSGGTGTHTIWKTHELVNGRIVTITGSNSIPSIDGKYEVSLTNLYEFQITPDIRVLTAGTTGAYVTEDNDFRDLKACYNAIITKLNSDTGVQFSNYVDIESNTIQESIITSVNRVTNTLTLNLTLDYVLGRVSIFEAIESSFTYTPSTMGDPLGWKHLREMTIMFEDVRFTNAFVSFATDLLPAFIEIPFPGKGNGIFGHQNFGTNFFGGVGNSVPLRTYIPRNAMRCRYLVIKFRHRIAREKFSIFGITITGNISQSTRAYK